MSKVTHGFMCDNTFLNRIFGLKKFLERSERLNFHREISNIRVSASMRSYAVKNMQTDMENVRKNTQDRVNANHITETILYLAAQKPKTSPERSS